jgi:tetratricopeptide (TPR) repeat protein
MTLATRVAILAAATTVALLAQSARQEGIQAFEQGRYSVALSKFDEVAKDGRDSIAVTFRALSQAALGDCTRALPVLTPMLTKENASEPKLVRLAGLAAAKCYVTAGDTGKAATAYQSLQARFPNDADVLYAVAKFHMKAFNDATFAMFQRTPASYRVHELSAEIFEVENRYSEAVAEYRKALEMNPTASELHFRLGRALLLQSHSAEALTQAAAEFRSELKLSPEDGACEFQLGQIAQVQGNTADATAHFERAIELSPNFVQALISLGKLASADKNYARAIELLSRATAAQPANEAAHYALLTAYRDSGQMDKAKAEKAILDRLQKPPEGEFSNFLKKLGEKQASQ